MSGPLDIEEVGNEITISLDHSHIHFVWPPTVDSEAGDPWADPLAMVDAILNEKVVSSSGWINDQLRVGSLHRFDEVPDLIVPNLQRVRVRSWSGTFDRDADLAKASKP